MVLRLELLKKIKYRQILVTAFQKEFKKFGSLCDLLKKLIKNFKVRRIRIFLKN